MHVTDIPSIAVAFVVIYWVLSKMFPAIDVSRFFKNGNVTKAEWELLFKRYDDLVKLMQQRIETEMINHMKSLDSISGNLNSINAVTDNLSRYIERVELFLKEMNNKINDLTSEVSNIAKSVEVIRDRRRK